VPDPLDIVVFKENNLTDENFSIILEAVQKQPRLRGIYTIKNIIGDETAKYLAQISTRDPPNHLEELVLNASKINVHNLEFLLGQLKACNSLKTLGLSQMRFEYHSTMNLIHIVKHSQSLLRLDISYAEFIKSRSLLLFLNATSPHN